MPTKLSEDSQFTVPLKNLIALIVVTGIAVTTYSFIDQRVSSLEFKVSEIWKKAVEHEHWIRSFKTPEEVKLAIKEFNDDIHRLEIGLARLEERLEDLQGSAP